MKLLSIKKSFNTYLLILLSLLLISLVVYEIYASNSIIEPKKKNTKKKEMKQKIKSLFSKGKNGINKEKGKTKQEEQEEQEPSINEDKSIMNKGKNKMKQKIKNLFNKVKNKKKNKDKIIDEQGVQIKILGEENAQLSKDLSNIQKNVSGLEEDVEEKDSVIESNKVTTANLQGKVNDVKTTNTELKGELQNTQEKLAFYETAYNSMITGV